MTGITKTVDGQSQFTIRIPRFLVFIFWIVVGLGVLVGLLFLWVAASTGPAAAAADRFFGSIVEGDMQAAYGLASDDFRQDQSADRFALEMATLGPASFKLQPWRERTLQRRGYSFLFGTMETKSGQTVDVTAQMLNEDGDWKVFSMTDRARVGVGPGAWFLQIPAEFLLREMVEETLLDLNEAVQAGDFETFYRKTAGTSVAEVKVAPVAESFDKLVEANVDITEIANLEAFFDQPPGFFHRTTCGAFGSGCRKTQLGELVLAGHFSLGTEVLRFDLAYRYLHPDWTLACSSERECIVSLEP